MIGTIILIGVGLGLTILFGRIMSDVNKPTPEQKRAYEQEKGRIQAREDMERKRLPMDNRMFKMNLFGR